MTFNVKDFIFVVGALWSTKVWTIVEDASAYLSSTVSIVGQ